MTTLSLQPRQWTLIGFSAVTPTLIFWSSVAFSRAFHNPRYVDMLLSYGGSYMHAALTAGFPLISFVIAILCRNALRKKAIAANLWHRETADMKVNQTLINCSVLLLSAMIINLITS